MAWSIFFAACGGTTVVNDDGGGGGNGGNGGGGKGGEGVQCPAVTCEPGASYIDELGCERCDPGGSCDDCGLGQQCSVCNSAGPTEYFCHDVQTPAPDEFQCKWLACGAEEICVDYQPLGDGCKDVECAETPAACPDRDCQCLLEHFGGIECNEDENGFITVASGPIL